MDKCVPVNPLCRTYESNGACTSCYPSYRVESGKCLLEQAQDPRCKTSRTDGFCDECFSGYYVRSGVCERVNPLCKTYNQLNGNCLSCYKGYEVKGGSCVIFFRDPNCK